MTEKQENICDEIMNQQREIYKQIPKLVRVTCECGKRPDIRYAFRCYYCGIYFCKVCAGKHFGDSPEKQEMRSFFNAENIADGIKH
jgi:predicted nucleic acid binding AN1-type Zn finger protein